VENSFLSRWSKRKLDGEETAVEKPDLPASGERFNQSQAANNDAESQPDLSEEEQSSSSPSVASLLASEAEATVKKAALRKLFLSGEFSEIDGLNDYDHDYKSVKSLSSDVAEKLRDWMEQPEQEPTSLEEQNTHPADELQQSEQPSLEDQPELSTPEDEQLGQNIPHR